MTNWRQEIWLDARVQRALQAAAAATLPELEDALDVHLNPHATVRDLFRDGVEALVERRERVAAAIYRGTYFQTAGTLTWEQLAASEQEVHRDVYTRCMLAAGAVMTELER